MMNGIFGCFCFNNSALKRYVNFVTGIGRRRYPIAEYSTRYMEFICKLRVKPNVEFTCIMRSIGHA